MGRSIWILNHYAVTPDLPGGTRHLDLGYELSLLGHDVTVFASAFNHSLRRKVRLQNGERWDVEEVKGIKFVWLPSFAYRGNDWRRVLNMLDYAWRAYSVGMRLPRLDDRIPVPDAIIGSSVHLLAVLSGYALARRFRSYFVMEVRDLWPQTLVDMGALSERSLQTRVLRRLERFLYRRAERIIVLLPGAKTYIAKLGVDVDKVWWIPNGVSLSRLPKQERAAEADEQFRVMYVGAHGQANGLDVLLDAAAEMQRRECTDVGFVLVGDGPEKRRLMEYSSSLGLDNVEFKSPVVRAEVPTVLAGADALIMILRDIDAFKYGISSNKLFDYLSSGRPVLFACNASNNIVEEAQCGLSVPPEDPEALADAIARLHEMEPAERRAMGERGRAYVQQHHDYAVLAQTLQKLLEGLIE